jgi:hypothetical protein
MVEEPTDMLRITVLFSLLPLLATCSETAESEIPQPRFAATGKSGGLIIVELFQSQGCSSCPPANAALNAIADQPNIIALSFAVTYWDRLGWKDSFANPVFTDRQYAYSAALGNKGVYTPQVVLNGARDIVGNGKGELAAAIAKTSPLSDALPISADGKNVSVGAGKGKGTVWLVRYDPRSQQVAVKTGENAGRTLPHKNIVRQLAKLGSWSGTAASYALPPRAHAGLKTVILVHSGNAGPILAAKSL